MKTEQNFVPIHPSIKERDLSATFNIGFGNVGTRVEVRQCEDYTPKPRDIYNLIAARHCPVMVKLKYSMFKNDCITWSEVPTVVVTSEHGRGFFRQRDGVIIIEATSEDYDDAIKILNELNLKLAPFIKRPCELV